MRNNGVQGQGRRPHKNVPYDRIPVMRTKPSVSTGSSEFECQRFSSHDLSNPLRKPKSRSKKSNFPSRRRQSVSQGSAESDCSRQTHSSDQTGNRTTGLNFFPELNPTSHSRSSPSLSWSLDQPKLSPTREYSVDPGHGHDGTYPTGLPVMVPENFYPPISLGMPAEPHRDPEFRAHSFLYQGLQQPYSYPPDQSSLREDSILSHLATQHLPFHDEQGMASGTVAQYPFVLQQQFEFFNPVSDPGDYSQQPSNYSHNYDVPLRVQALDFSSFNPPTNGPSHLSNRHPWLDDMSNAPRPP